MGREVAAQGLTLTQGEEGKNVDVESVMDALFVGSSDEATFWLMKDDDRDDRWSVLSLDLNMKELKRLDLPLGSGYERIAVMQVGSAASVVMVDSSAAKRTTVVRVAIDLDSLVLSQGGIDTLADVALAKGDGCHVWGAVSASGEYMGLLTVHRMAAKKQYVAEAMMFDAGMQMQWRKEFPVGRTASVAVTDEGLLVTLGNEHQGTVEHLQVSVIGEDRGESYLAEISSDRVESLQIVSVLGRKVIGAGVFAPTGSKAEDRLVRGTAMMVFDIDSMAVTGFSLNLFQNEDVNIMLNKKTKKVQKDRAVPMVVPLASAAMPWGAVLAVGHRHGLRSVNANGTVSTTYYTQGIHLVAIDEDANVRWVRNIRRNDMAKGDEGLLYMALFAQDDTVCLLKSESYKYPEDYNIAKEAKEYEMGDKGNLVLYRVAGNGDVEKQILEAETKHTLVSAVRCADDSLILTTVKGKKSRLMKGKR